MGQMLFSRHWLIILPPSPLPFDVELQIYHHCFVNLCKKATLKWEGGRGETESRKNLIFVRDFRVEWTVNQILENHLKLKEKYMFFVYTFVHPEFSPPTIEQKLLFQISCHFFSFLKLLLLFFNFQFSQPPWIRHCTVYFNVYRVSFSL